MVDIPKTEPTNQPTNQTVFDNIVVVGARTRCVFLHSLCSLKAAPMNMQLSLILKNDILVRTEP